MKKKTNKTPAPARHRQSIGWIIRGLLPHVIIIMSSMFVVFFAIDVVNSHQGFLTNEFHKILIFALSLCAIAESVILIAVNRRIVMDEIKKAKKAKKTGKTKKVQSIQR